MDLKGVNALVTGAGRGIGAAIARSLAEAGCDLALAARTEAELASVAAEVRAAGRRALVVPTDLTRPDETRALAERALRELGPIDVLVNNAGGGVFQPVLAMSEEDFERTIELNLTSVFRLTKALLPSMVQRRKGHVVMIASTSARRGSAGSGAYAAAKFGLNGFAQSLFYETRKHDVRVTTVFPSSVNTVLMRGLDDGARAERWIQPEDIAEAVLAALQTPDRATVKEIEVWGTNP